MHRNGRLLEAARAGLPGGVNSPVRAFRSVGGTPLTLRSGRGPYVRDADGREYVDMVCGWGAQILGHADPRVVAALRRRAGRGTVFGAPAIEETQLARRILAALPGAERVRFVNSGTGATMSALRLARAATGRDLVVKLAGCYHGHADALLSSAGSGALTLGTPDSPGVPEDWARTTLTATYNDLASVRRVFEAHGDAIAAVIVEPVVGNMGCIPPADGWLAGLRQITRDHGALLVLDEVMTGFRVAWGGAQVRFGVQPDLTCLGKVIGGGMPVGAYARPAALMDPVAPAGPVYQAGTPGGTPSSVGAGRASLRARGGPEPYATLERTGAAIEERLLEAARAAGVPVRVQRVGSMLTVFFAAADGPVRDLAAVQATRTDLFPAFHRGLREGGVSWPPSNFEAAFFTLAHDAVALERLARAADGAFRAVAAAI